MASHDLLPCPFCGGPGEMFESEDEDGRFAAIICKQCGCGSRQHYFVKEDAREFAASAWNTRASETELREALKAARCEICHTIDENSGVSSRNTQRNILVAQIDRTLSKAGQL